MKKNKKRRAHLLGINSDSGLPEPDRKALGIALALRSPEPKSEVMLVITDPHSGVTTAAANADGPQSDPAIAPSAITQNAWRNGDETDVRMEEIAKILDYAGMHCLEKCSLVAEWVHHAASKASVYGQVVRKPQGGRPEGGTARAARELPVPGRSEAGRRKFVERALKIDGIWPEAKAAARALDIDDNQSALLAIAMERSLETQLAKVTELAELKALPRVRRKTANNARQTQLDGNRGPSTVTAPERLSDEQETALAVLRASWSGAGMLNRDAWEKSEREVQCRFVVTSLLTEIE